MLGHDLTLHETNTRGAVAICQCGWYGAAHPAIVYRTGRSPRLMASRERAIEAAVAEHREHVVGALADVVAQSDAELARIGGLSAHANATLQHRGRFGHP